MVSGEIDLAGRHEKAAMDQVNDPVGQVAGKIWAVIIAAIFPQAARDVDPRIALTQRQLDVRISLIVTKQDVEARLLLLDQVIFKGQRFLIVGNNDVLNVHGLAQKASGFGIGFTHAFLKIRAHAGAEVLSLAYINDLTFGVFI